MTSVYKVYLSMKSHKLIPLKKQIGLINPISRLLQNPFW